MQRRAVKRRVSSGRANFEGGSQMAELRRDQVFGLVDLAAMSLADIAELDDAVIGRTIDTLLPACGSVGGRLWQNNVDDAR